MSAIQTVVVRMHTLSSGKASLLPASWWLTAATVRPSCWETSLGQGMASSRTVARLDVSPYRPSGSQLENTKRRILKCVAGRESTGAVAEGGPDTGPVLGWRSWAKRVLELGQFLCRGSSAEPAAILLSSPPGKVGASGQAGLHGHGSPGRAPAVTALGPGAGAPRGCTSGPGSSGAAAGAPRGRHFSAASCPCLGDAAWGGPALPVAEPSAPSPCLRFHLPPKW